MPTLSLSFIGGVLAALLNLQGAPPPAPACYLLTTEDIASIIGTTRPLIITNTGAGSTCIFQNGDRTVTVLMVTLGSAEAAKRQWDAKKRVTAGQDAAGWPTPAYVGTIDTAEEHVAIVGVYSSLTFVEARASDRTQKTADLSTTLQTAMKAYSARLASQK